MRRLLEAQHLDLAALPLREFGSGWDNAIYRLGDALCVRLPRREVAAALVRNEQRWLPSLASRLPLPIPVPIRCGEPGADYPWPWSVCPFFAGETAAARPPQNLHALADTLGAFIVALHHEAPAEAPENPVRGVPLAVRTQAVETASCPCEIRSTALEFARCGTNWSRRLNGTAPRSGFTEISIP